MIAQQLTMHTNTKKSQQEWTRIQQDELYNNQGSIQYHQQC